MKFETIVMFIILLCSIGIAYISYQAWQSPSFLEMKLAQNFFFGIFFVGLFATIISLISLIINSTEKKGGT